MRAILFVCRGAGPFVGSACTPGHRHDRSGRRGVGLRSPSGAHPSPLRSPAKKMRREAGEVASRRAGANTGNCSQLLCREQSPCQINKPNKNKLLYRCARPRRGDVNCHFGAQRSIVGRGGPQRLPARDSAGHHRNTGLVLLAERVADRACLRLSGCRCLQSIELPGATVGNDDPRR